MVWLPPFGGRVGWVAGENWQGRRDLQPPPRGTQSGKIWSLPSSAPSPTTPQSGLIPSHLRASAQADPKGLHQVHQTCVLSSFSQQTKTTSLNPQRAGALSQVLVVHALFLWLLILTVTHLFYHYVFPVCLPCWNDAPSGWGLYWSSSPTMRALRGWCVESAQSTVEDPTCSERCGNPWNVSQCK